MYGSPMFLEHEVCLCTTRNQLDRSRTLHARTQDEHALETESLTRLSKPKHLLYFGNTCSLEYPTPLNKETI